MGGDLLIFALMVIIPTIVVGSGIYFVFRKLFRVGKMVTVIVSVTAMGLFLYQFLYNFGANLDQMP